MSDPAQTSTWGDYDLVYVDPETNSVVKKVEWNPSGNPKPLPYVSPPGEPGKEERRRFWRKVYPWGTFRSMKNVFKVDGKPRKKEPTETLEQVLPKALKDPYWD